MAVYAQRRYVETSRTIRANCAGPASRYALCPRRDTSSLHRPRSKDPLTDRACLTHVAVADVVRAGLRESEAGRRLHTGLIMNSEVAGRSPPMRICDWQRVQGVATPLVGSARCSCQVSRRQSAVATKQRLLARIVRHAHAEQSLRSYTSPNSHTLRVDAQWFHHRFVKRDFE